MAQNMESFNTDYQRNIEGDVVHLKHGMEEIVSLLLEFWSQFIDDKPDFIKLSDIGSKLYPVKLMIDQIWKKISKSRCENLPSILKIYSKYLIEIFNDK